MTKHKPKNLSYLVGLYLLISVLVFSAGLLLWSYKTAIQAVDEEFKTTFNQRHTIAEGIIENQVEILELALHEIGNNTLFLEEVIQKRSAGTQAVLFNIIDSNVDFNLDIILVSLFDDVILTEASSPLFDLPPVFPEIVKKKNRLLSSGVILRIKKTTTDYTLLLRAIPIIERKGGRVLGTLIGGFVLNSHLSLMETIKRRTKSSVIAFFENGDLIGSSELIESPATKALEIARKTQPVGKVYSENQFLTSYNPIYISGRKTSLEVATAVPNKQLIDLKRSFLNQAAIILIISIVFWLFTVFAMKRLAYPSLKRLLNYSREISSGNLQSSYEVGQITELNRIGHSMEKMVESLKTTNLLLSKENAERRDAEESLRKSEARFQNIAANIPGAVYQFVKKTDGTYQFPYISEGIQYIFGRSAEEFMNDVDLLFSLIDRDNIEAVFQAIEESAATLGHFSSKFKIKLADGTLKWVNAGSSPEKLSNGDILWNGVLFDISEIMESNRELARLRKLLINIINSMPSVLIGVNQDLTISQWNLEAEKMTGISHSEALGQRFKDILTNIVGGEEKITKAINDRQVQKGSQTLTHIDGEARVSDITVFPLITNGIEGAVIRIDDITEKTRIEEMMIQTEKMMSVGGLAAGMAHEINNPLAVIIQNVQLLGNRLSNRLPKNRKIADEIGISLDRIQTYVERRGIGAMLDAIMEAGKRAAKIVDNMLSFSRNSGSNFLKYNMSNLVDKTLELAENDYDLKQKYDFRKIKIIKNYDDMIPDVLCEEVKIQQVFLNILKNAAQAMNEVKERLPQIKISVRQEEQTVCVEFEDNGPGMDEGVRKRIFEPFYTTKEIGIGTGLGLSISYFIITSNHNGSMTVESTPGMGTKFMVRLPINKKTF